MKLLMFLLSLAAFLSHLACEEQTNITTTHKERLIEASEGLPTGSPAHDKSIPQMPSEDMPRNLDFISVDSQPYSTVSIDVDSASFTRVRANLENGIMPDPVDVRIEEFLNYFEYSYPEPNAGEPVSISYEEAASPWTDGYRLAKIGLQSKSAESIGEFSAGRNFVFLIDTSGSMSGYDGIGLLKEALNILVSKLLPTDVLSIVTYAGSSQILLDGGDIAASSDITTAINNLTAGGGTNGADGIRTAYQLAEKHFIPNGVNRLILATDGDFNVGRTDAGGLIESARSYGDQNIYLTVLGFRYAAGGDSRMEALSNDANGNYFFIDSSQEAERVLSDKINSTLVTVARDVKVQIEFNPRLVKSYRLIGYLNRRLNDEDFNNDAKDAGDLGSEHQVTYLYEYLPRTSDDAFVPNYELPEGVDPLRYQNNDGLTEAALENESLSLKLRYKAPEGLESQVMSTAMSPSASLFADASSDFIFATAVATFAARLRQVESIPTDYEQIEQWLTQANTAGSYEGSDTLMKMLSDVKIIIEKQ